MALLMAAGVMVWVVNAVLPASPTPPTTASDGAHSAPEAGTGQEPPTSPAPTDARGSPAPQAAGSSAPAPRAKYVENGPGTYRWAEGTSSRAGTGGRLVRYGVKLEDGTGLNVHQIATEIDGILRDRRGWINSGEASFQRVDSPPYDMVVHVVSPGTTDKLCGAWGLDTRGQVNCASRPDLVVNVRRWIELSDQYPDRPADYHALIINHEVGHVLGHGHRGCPGRGKPAPAMMQQIKGLKGCSANPWVYDEEGRLIDGPPKP
ncbi:DUF3152 domain-containing protein [Streptomyces albipurpureus]|uniref:DUF3152 domain-containing protein n=1 Tax=Streptomyces albipurpureus TaxID=2897419 RepID=A0ABT0UFD0_9ACTN|nr:DUF3152 domain-containing protein [Streptomyces sp. CWNU-1]MCM2387089.1 DUF3152 domain-containing protein [Streptomyces sp. CWNU-1]